MLLLSDGDNLRDDKCAEGEGGVSSTERIAGLVLSVDELEIRVSRFKKEKGISKDEVVSWRDRDSSVVKVVMKVSLMMYILLRFDLLVESYSVVGIDNKPSAVFLGSR